MLRLSLTIIGFYISVLAAFSQMLETDSSFYKKKKLKLEEVNLVSSYYSQNGNNAAISGGRGSEQLTDISNLLDLKFVKSDTNKLKVLDLKLGVDAYSSASSDSIDPHTISSASRSDRRIYPSVSYTVKDSAKRYAVGLTGYFSTEYDYTSFGPGINFTKYSKDNSRDLTIRLQAFIDKIQVILPIELRNKPNVFTGNSNRNSLNASFIYSQVINKRTQLAVLLDLVYQNGLLSLPFNRVYFTNNELRIENLPGTRFKLPIGFRLNYFLGSRIVVRSFYRFYYDTWNLTANTFSLEVPVKITPFLSLGPIYRFYNQTAVDYFAPYKQHQPTEEFYTSDYDLSGFSSHLIGLNLRKVSASGILGIKKWNVLEVRYSYYYRTTGLRAHSIALAFKFK